jgi:hypothetical protein
MSKRRGASPETRAKLSEGLRKSWAAIPLEKRRALTAAANAASRTPQARAKRSAAMWKRDGLTVRPVRLSVSDVGALSASANEEPVSTHA